MHWAGGHILGSLFSLRINHGPCIGIGKTFYFFSSIGFNLEWVRGGKGESMKASDRHAPGNRGFGFSVVLISQYSCLAPNHLSPFPVSSPSKPPTIFALVFSLFRGESLSRNLDLAAMCP